jgi:Undecaprenyl-phosphate glucose phosphotransferase
MLILVLLDQFILVGSMLAAVWIKKHWLLPDPLLPARQHFELFLRLWPFLALVLILTGAYDLQVAVGRLRPLLRRTLRGAVVMAGVWIAGSFYLKMSELFTYSRAIFSLFLVFSVVGLVVVRLAYVKIASAWRRKTGQYRRVLLFGGESLGPMIIRNLRRHVFVPMQIVGVTGDVDLPDDVPRLTVEEALQQMRQGQIDHVIVDLPPRRIRELLRVAQVAELEGVPLQITPSIFPGIHLKPRVDHIGRTPVIELCGDDLPLSGLFAKRALDLILSIVGLIVLSPLLLFIALVIKLTSPGPVFYTRERVGLDGRRFNMLKFRTMVVGAEEEAEPGWTRPDDARRTPVGRLLRRTNLDEFPQLFNVLVGSMSLVGPRPERPEMVEQFKPLVDRYSHKHWVKPGMTGWAQVNGWRGRTDLKRRIEHDIYYIERWSLWFDLKILFLTLFRGYKNAY